MTNRLSISVSRMQNHYKVVVVGSGYGGSIAASRMARAGQSVCVLERGREFQPGEFPGGEIEAIEQMQAQLPDGHIGSRVGLFDFHVNPDINVLVGCGLGGTSLINANVSLHPDERVFDNPRWPGAFRRDLHDGVAQGYARATDMLRPVPYPAASRAPSKLSALEKSARALGDRARFYRPPINVNFNYRGPNHVGVEQQPCNDCGDCVSGCNNHAKNTTAMNYLPDAKAHGAEIFTGTDVQFVEKRNDGTWIVHFHVIETGQEAFDAPTRFVAADVVILAAGTLGSTGLLLRSAAKGLGVSGELGKHFSGNGDVLGFGYNLEQDINGIGFGYRSPNGREPVGPCITGIIDLRGRADVEAGLVIEEGSIPGALAATMPGSLSAASAVNGEVMTPGPLATTRRFAREAESVACGPYHGATRNTQTYLVMAHDGSDGELHLEDDRVRIRWPGVGDKAQFRFSNNTLRDATRPLGGVYLRNPTWSKLLHHSLITVHPLGGCVMGEDSTSGVVNHKGQVFASRTGDSVHEGLYVSDGSAIPGSLGVNPLLTICAVAERCCAIIADEKGWKIDYRFETVLPEPAPTDRRGIEFTERMAGFFSTAERDDYMRGASRGRTENSPMAFVLTIRSDDLDAMLTDPNHLALLAGTVTAPALSSRPLTVTHGELGLFVRDPDEVETRLMRYTMHLTAEDGHNWLFEGFKRIHADPRTDAWTDATTLFVTLYDETSKEASAAGKGILTLDAGDFSRQMRTLRVTNARNAADRLDGLAQFGKYFVGTLFDTYGGMFVGSGDFDSMAPPRQRRALRAPVPTVHTVVTKDNVPLRLTRFEAGEKGPVILSPGLGVSSLIFSIETIETNLLEYLCAHGYDCWLFDYRTSIALPSATELASGDMVAQFDYPAAVDFVRKVTGAPSVQVVVHCFGSTTWFMSMLGGYLTGVRSAVVSQIATNIRTPTMTKVKAGLHLPDVLEALHVRSMTAYSAKHESWKSRLFDDLLRIQPIDQFEHCHSDVCHRITFLYSLLYQHEQLNEATHNALVEMFGAANVAALDHLSVLVREGVMRNAAGEDVYMPHFDRLAIPITFIHGGSNQCFLPVSTELTYDLLRRANKPELYDRYVIPGYGHIDCIFGKNAAYDVYPHILARLEQDCSVGRRSAP